MNTDNFYRQAQGLTVSSLGLGTYLGEMDEETDGFYQQAILEALRGGINFIDTSLNYRHQRSERAIGAALRAAESPREKYVVCTKAGYLVPGAAPAMDPGDVVGGMHSMAPKFLADQLERSRKNLGLDTIDVFYLHNPETQLEFVAAEEFYARLERAFEFLECAPGVSYYGAATWNGFRTGQLSLKRMAEIGGSRFRFIQLPLNLAMTEALSRGVLEEAADLGLSVVASASLLQTRLLGRIPEELAARFPGLATDAQRAIQFTRSAPGVTVALVGMGRPEHVRENLGVARVPPMTPDEFKALFA